MIRRDSIRRLVRLPTRPPDCCLSPRLTLWCSVMPPIGWSATKSGRTPTAASLLWRLHPVTVYTVQGMRRYRAVRALHPRPESVCGRARELAILHERLAYATQGQGQVVGLVGEPGMGSHGSSTNPEPAWAGGDLP